MKKRVDNFLLPDDPEDEENDHLEEDLIGDDEADEEWEDPEEFLEE